jgi:adenosine deaminase
VSTGRELATLPKAHLHIHLEGAMRPATLQELATGYGMDVPETRGFGSFAAFAGMYIAACEVLRTPDDLRRLVLEVVEDSVAGGAIWVEPSVYVPRHRERIGSDETVVEIILDAAREAEARFDVGVGLMVAADRTLDPLDAVEQAKLASRYVGQGVVSFGLANDEEIGPPGDFEHAYDIARHAGLMSTPHAGELCGPESVQLALERLHADRIQHGVRAVEDPALVERLIDAGVCLDVCPTSNLLLGVVSSLAVHPLPQLLEAGVACSINADDPLLFGPGLLEEYELCRSELGLSDEQLATAARDSIACSGASETLKERGAAAVAGWLGGAP